MIATHVEPFPSRIEHPLTLHRHPTTTAVVSIFGGHWQMETAAALRAEAEVFRRNHEWQKASDKFSDLLDLVYSRDSDLTPEVCTDLLHYSECLIEGFAPGDDEDDSDLETAWECLEHVRVTYERMDSAPNGKLADVYDLLGQISLKNGRFEEAVGQYSRMAEVAVGLSWRVRLNALFLKAVALRMNEKDAEALVAFRAALSYLDGERVNTENARDVSDFNAIREGIEQRITELSQPPPNARN
jgi:hypothetical protein